jgi:hypothetical protein
MYIIGVDYHPSFQQIVFWIRKLGNAGNGDSTTVMESGEKILSSAWRSSLKKCLRGPTWLEMSGKRGGFNGLTQH